MEAKVIKISTNYIYVASDTRIETANLGQAEKGCDAIGVGQEGGKGEDGAPAGNLTITASKKLTSSAGSLMFTSKGQTGGEGGSGGGGKPMDADFCKQPTTPQQVANMGELYDHTHTQHKHCGLINTCHCDDDYWYYRYMMNKPDGCCGGDGGKAGNGGNGGAAGLLTITGDSGVYPINNRLPANGGSPGPRGTGAYGLTIDKVFKSWYRAYESVECWDGHFSCHYHDHDSWGGWAINPNNQTDCPGQPGEKGNSGDNWEES